MKQKLIRLLTNDIDKAFSKLCDPHITDCNDCQSQWTAMTAGLSVTPLYYISPRNSKHSAFKKQPQSVSPPTHSDFRRGSSSHYFTFQLITPQRQQRILMERPHADRNGLKERAVLHTTRILGNNGFWMHEAVILHNELFQFREMTHLHDQDVREGIGTNVDGLQRWIVLQTQLLHVHFASTL